MDQTCIENETILNIDYSNQSLENMEYESCTFKNCNFSASSLKASRFYETEFINCNLSNADVSRASFQNVKFKNCKMLGLHYDKCNGLGFAVSFEQCQINHSIFYQMKLIKTSFVDTQLHSVDFTEAVLKGVILRNCDLLNATFENTNLEKADLTKSTNYIIDPEINKIKGAKFSLPDVIGLLTIYEIEVE